MHESFHAERFDDINVRSDGIFARSRGGNRKVLWPNADRHLATNVRVARISRGPREVEVPIRCVQAQSLLVTSDGARDEVGTGSADKARHKLCSWVQVQLLRRRNLLNRAIVH